MSSFIQAILRLASGKPRPPKARPDEEHAITTTAAYSAAGSSTLPPSNVPATGTRVSSDDSLTLFRLMLGIATPPHLGFSGSPARPADNVGLYARVVHSEQQAKDSYKIFSAVINACYFLQIIVAAALTALGAANANHQAITAFGAINTIIAGFLTYLKGSGYPARLKYYANEWKKVREFIEHRERDFSLEGCTLDVYEVVDVVRDMYDSTKREIEMNTPDGYNSKTTSTRFDSASVAGLNPARAADAVTSKLRGLDDTVRKLGSHLPGGLQSKADDVVGKLRGLDDTVQKLRSHIPGGLDAKADDVVGKLRGLDDTVHRLRSNVGSVSRDVEATGADVVTRLQTLEDTLEKVKSEVRRTSVGAVRGAVRDTARDAAHGAADTASQVVQDEEKRMLAELRSLGKEVARDVDEHRPRLPREVSITLSHQDSHGERPGGS